MRELRDCRGGWALARLLAMLLAHPSTSRAQRNTPAPASRAKKRTGRDRGKDEENEVESDALNTSARQGRVSIGVEAVLRELLTTYPPGGDKHGVER